MTASPGCSVHSKEDRHYTLEVMIGAAETILKHTKKKTATTLLYVAVILE